MQSLDFITDGKFENSSIDGLLLQIDKSCFEEGCFSYQIESLSTIDSESQEVSLSESEVAEAQEKLDTMLSESQALWQSQRNSIYDSERGEIYWEVL